MTPAARRDAVAHLREIHAVSERRACRAIGVDRSMVRYRSVRADDTAIRERLRALAADRQLSRLALLRVESPLDAIERELVIVGASMVQGDLVLAVNGTPVSNVDELRKLAGKAGKHVALLVKRDEARLFVPLELG